MDESCTVVVASRNRPEHLQLCLECLTALDYPNVSVIVVDDGSDTPLAPIAATFGDMVKVIRQENLGPAAARNRGVDAAQTDFIAFTDDDCRPAPDWLTHLHEAHRTDPEALVGGRTVNELADNACAAASQSIIDFLYRWYDETDDRLQFFTTNNIGFSRRTFRALGGLDPQFVFASEDRDLGLRWRASGRRLIYAKEAVVGHRHDLSLPGFWRQHVSYGHGARRLRVKLGADDARLRLEPWAFYLGLLTGPVTRRDPGGLVPALMQMGLVFLSQIAMTQGYMAQRREERAAMAFAVPAAPGLEPAPGDVAKGPTPERESR